MDDLDVRGIGREVGDVLDPPAAHRAADDPLCDRKAVRRHSEAAARDVPQSVVLGHQGYDERVIEMLV